MTTCDREMEIVAAVRDGVWSDGLREHLAGCESCAEAAMVAGCLLEADRAEETVVPATGLVWWKAQLRARRDAVRRAELPVRVAEGVAAAVVVAAAGTGLAYFGASSNWIALAAAVAAIGLAAVAGGVAYVAWIRKQG